MVRLHTSHEVALLSCGREGRGVGKDHTCVYIELLADSGSSSESVKVNRYTFIELADMHLCFGFANANAARRYYAQRFPGRNLPSVNFFSIVDQILRETGSLQVSKHFLLLQNTACDNEIEVIL